MSSNGNGKLSFGDFTLDPSKRVVWHRDEPVDLPLKAVDLLCLLVERRGDVVTKDEIWKNVWNDAFIEETNLTHNIYLLRKTFRELGAGDLIKTVPRRGYRFSGEVSDERAPNVIFERATITDTIIEEVAVPETPALTMQKNFAIAAIGLVVVALIGSAVWYAGGLAASKPKIETLAVLPFKTLNTTTEQDHTGVGIADLLITRLSRIKELKVRPTSSVMQIAGTEVLVAGERLDVDAALEGTVYRTRDSVRITARLVRIADASVIWSGEFQKPQQDELALQNELAMHIVDALSANLRDEERAAILKTYTGSVDAFRLYERGRFEWNKRNHAGMTEAQRLFRNAIEKDPNFALAYSGLADTLATGSQWNEASAAATRALQIDPYLAEAHATDGFVKMFGGWNWDEAERSFRRSIELNPGYATAHHWYATLLAIRGRTDGAKAEMQRAIDINPVSFNYLADLGQLYYFSGDYEKAREYCNRALALNSDFAFAHQYLYFINLKTGDYENAVEEIIKSDRAYGTATDFAGKNEESEKYFEQVRLAFREKQLRGFLDLKYGPKAIHPDAYYFFALKHALLGENDLAIDYLEKASEAKTFLTAFVKAEPIFKNLRGDPRYQEVLKKMRLDG